MGGEPTSIGMVELKRYQVDAARVTNWPHYSNHVMQGSSLATSGA